MTMATFCTFTVQVPEVSEPQKMGGIQRIAWGHHVSRGNVRKNSKTSRRESKRREMGSKRQNRDSSKSPCAYVLIISSNSHQHLTNLASAITHPPPIFVHRVF